MTCQGRNRKCLPRDPVCRLQAKNGECERLCLSCMENTPFSVKTIECRLTRVKEGKCKVFSRLFRKGETSPCLAHRGAELHGDLCDLFLFFQSFETKY